MARSLHNRPRAVIRRIPGFFGLPALVYAFDPGEGINADLLLRTHLWADIFRGGRWIETIDLGTGVITIKYVNDIVTQAVAGSSAVPVFSAYTYMDVGLGSTAATDVQTALVTPSASAPARVNATKTNAQTADGSNHAAIYQLAGTSSFTANLAIVEWGLFDSPGTGSPVTGGNMGDRRAFSVLNVGSGDQIGWTWQLTLPSNG